VAKFLFELRSEIIVSFIKEPFNLTRCAENDVWFQSLIYLADIFSIINELNLSLHGLIISVFSVQGKIESTMKKLQFWERCIESSQTESFCNLHIFLIVNQLKLDQNTKTNIIEHLRGLSATLKEYLPVLSYSIN
jgi:hypothetical protein